MNYKNNFKPGDRESDDERSLTKLSENFYK